MFSCGEERSTSRVQLRGYYRPPWRGSCSFFTSRRKARFSGSNGRAKSGFLAKLHIFILTSQKKYS